MKKKQKVKEVIIFCVLHLREFNRKSIDDNDIMIIYESFLFKEKNKCYKHTNMQRKTREIHISGAP
jgi:hypothetical protein